MAIHKYTSKQKEVKKTSRKKRPSTKRLRVKKRSSRRNKSSKGGRLNFLSNTKQRIRDFVRVTRDQILKPSVYANFNPRYKTLEPCDSDKNTKTRYATNRETALNHCQWEKVAYYDYITKYMDNDGNNVLTKKETRDANIKYNDHKKKLMQYLSVPITGEISVLVTKLTEIFQLDNEYNIYTQHYTQHDLDGNVRQKIKYTIMIEPLNTIFNDIGVNVNGGTIKDESQNSYVYKYSLTTNNNQENIDPHAIMEAYVTKKTEYDEEVEAAKRRKKKLRQPDKKDDKDDEIRYNKRKISSEYETPKPLSTDDDKETAKKQQIARERTQGKDENQITNENNLYNSKFPECSLLLEDWKKGVQHKNFDSSFRKKDEIINRVPKRFIEIDENKEIKQGDIVKFKPSFIGKSYSKGEILSINGNNTYKIKNISNACINDE